MKTSLTFAIALISSQVATAQLANAAHKINRRALKTGRKKNRILQEMPLDDGSMSMAAIAGAGDGLVPAASNDGPLAKSSKSKSEKTKTCELQLQLSGASGLVLENTSADVAALCAVTTTLAAAAGSVSAMFTDILGAGLCCGLSGLTTYPVFFMQSEPVLAEGFSIGNLLADAVWNLTFSVSEGECSDVATVLSSMFTSDSDLSRAIR